MATLQEYFIKDGSKTFCISKPMQIEKDGKVLLEISSRLHLDFEAKASYLSFYIPKTTEVTCASRLILNQIDDVINSLLNAVYLEAGYIEEKTPSTELRFTGRIYIYSEDEISFEDTNYIETRSKELGHSVIFRLENYAIERSKFEKPLAFISHDSKDKDSIAKPLAVEMQKLMCPVWYDEFSLKIGDSLKDSIEKGIRECHKCIFLLTPNFLSNSGWAKREYDSIFTRELVESQNVILSVWSDVSVEEVYKYSPILADRLGANWNDGVEKVARQLVHSIGI